MMITEGKQHRWLPWHDRQPITWLLLLAGCCSELPEVDDSPQKLACFLHAPSMGGPQPGTLESGCAFQRRKSLAVPDWGPMPEKPLTSSFPFLSMQDVA
eukprot:scaffold214214_cov18-Tisochrysis_lutea.AAC.3